MPIKPKLKATKDKIASHLKDINDTISEEDISRISSHPVSRHTATVDDGIIEFHTAEKKDAHGSPGVKKDFENENSRWNIIS